MGKPSESTAQYLYELARNSGLSHEAAAATADAHKEGLRNVKETEAFIKKTADMLDKGKLRKYSED